MTDKDLDIITTTLKKWTGGLLFGLFLALHPLSANDTAALIISAITDADEEVQVNMLTGLLQGLQGVKHVPAPQGWDTFTSSVSASKRKDLQSLVRLLNQKFGDLQALQRALHTLQNPKAPLDERRLALASLVSQHHADLLPALNGLLTGPLQIDAIRAHGTFNETRIPTTLLEHYPQADAKARRAILETLATRKEFALALVTALKKETVLKKDIPAYVARNLHGLLGKTFSDVYGEPLAVAGDKATLIASYKKKLGSSAFSKADASAGRAVFERTCAACHTLYDTGAKLGPELTGSNRADQDYILLNIIDPSFDVPDAYRMVTITKTDGQVLAGMVQNEDDTKLTISMVGINTIVAKAEIKKRAPSAISLMPEGLLTTLTDKDFFNLIKYLQTSKQVELPK